MIEQEVINEISSLLGLYKDQGTARWHRDEKVIEGGLFCMALNPDDLLKLANVEVINRGLLPAESH